MQRLKKLVARQTRQGDAQSTDAMLMGFVRATKGVTNVGLPEIFCCDVLILLRRDGAELGGTVVQDTFKALGHWERWV